MEIKQLKELFKNSVIKWGYVQLYVDNQVVAGFEVDEIANDDDKVTFTYSDQANGLEKWRGERAPYFAISLEDIIGVKQVFLYDGMLGKYQIKIELKNMQVVLHFDANDVVSNIGEYGLKLDKYDQAEKDYLDLILNHDGSFLINVNSGDFTESQSIEVYNLVFTNVRALHNNSLLSFDNSTMHPVGYKEKNIPIYPMDFCTNFYVDLKKMINIEEIDSEENQDVFEYPTTRIFNLSMKDKSIVTIGLYGGCKEA